MITNPIIEVDETAGTGSCRWGHLPLAGDYYSVIQQTDDLPLQVIVAGRYHDRFLHVDGRWRYAFRDYSLMDMIGDVSHHLNRPIAEIGGTA